MVRFEVLPSFSKTWEYVKSDRVIKLLTYVSPLVGKSEKQGKLSNVHNSYCYKMEGRSSLAARFGINCQRVAASRSCILLRGGLMMSFHLLT